MSNAKVFNVLEESGLLRNKYLCAFLARDNTSVALLLLLVAAFSFVLRPSIRGHDGVLNYAYLRSVLIDRDLDFTNDYHYYLSRESDWFDNQQLPRDPVTNRPINLYGVGSSILWSPWVLAAHAYCRLSSSRRDAWQADGFSFPYEAAVGLGSCFYASVGLLFLHLVLRRRFGRRTAFWTCISIWLATPLFFYTYLHPSMSHANSFFLAALLLWLYTNGDGIGRWISMGAAAGLLSATRFQDAALLAGIAAGEGWRILHARIDGDFIRSRAIRYILATAAALIMFSPQFVAWHYLQGSALSGPRAYLMQGSVRLWAPVHAVEVMFSPRHGVFYWHPMLLLGLLGLFVGRRLPRLRLICLVMFTAELWVVSCWSLWWAGASFGHRLFISALPALALGIASFIPRWRVTRSLTPAVVIILVVWNFGYVVQYGSGMISRQAAVGIRELAYNNVIRVPKLLLGINLNADGKK
ncbi:MAG: hypothetical protein ACR2IE_14695 [Candidatus Sumerlaeaceae bacterium]